MIWAESSHHLTLNTSLHIHASHRGHTSRTLPRLHHDRQPSAKVDHDELPRNLSQLLHPNPFVATHHPKDSPGLLYMVYIDNGALFGRPQGWLGEIQGFMRGRTPHGGRSLWIGPQGQAPLYMLDICIHVRGAGWHETRPAKSRGFCAAGTHVRLHETPRHLGRGFVPRWHPGVCLHEPP